MTTPRLFPEFSAQADYIDIDNILRISYNNEFYQSIRQQLLERGPRLLIGPRGVGKTHQMRLALAESIHNPELPFAVYISFNQYYHLEPLTKISNNARRVFHAWALLQIISSICEYVIEINRSDLLSSIFETIGFTKDDMIGFESIAQKGIDIDEHLVVRKINVKSVISVIRVVMKAIDRKRCVLLMDDAAMSLANEYLFEFFEIFQAIKAPDISPKASVYPGTTQYGPKFHPRHDAGFINAWLSVESPNYKESMVGIFRKQLQDLPISLDAIDLFAYASFGVPRLFLNMLRSFYEKTSKNTQSKINSVINEQALLVESEFMSLAYKVPQFKTIINEGRDFFEIISSLIVQENERLKDSNEKQIQIGITKDKDYQRPAVTRMISLMQEAGLLYQIAPVSHGEDRDYDRYIPHLINLIRLRAFAFSRGSSQRATVEFIERPNTKHAVRRKIRVLIPNEVLDSLAPDLPPCQACGTARINEDQKFCHNCGSPLIVKSIFHELLKKPVDELPFSPWLKNKIQNETTFRTISDFVTRQDPASELRQASGIGRKRSEKIVNIVNAKISEFLS